MKHVTLTLICLLAFAACKQTASIQEEPPFVTTKDGKFYIGNDEYHYIGANFWYGAILASSGRGGDRERLRKELDLMQEVGINNVRVLVGAEGTDTVSSHIVPILQPKPGVYNDTILRGLDYLLMELETRKMTAILYLNNSWEWSGGYGTYLNWAGCGDVPDASDWNAFQEYHCQFVQNDSAKAMAARHVEHIVTRVNTYTGLPYTTSPAIMAWELANEPRAFARDSVTKACFLQWVKDQAKLIKHLDPAHLVTTGSEGSNGCEEDMDLFQEVHAIPEIDYLCIHIWPFNWHWIGPNSGDTEQAKAANGETSMIDNLENACQQTLAYVDAHHEIAKQLKKPMVLEEFGYPRDGYALAPGSPTTGRDAYYKYVLDLVCNSNKLNGCNFWGWGGYATRLHNRWQRWDDYTCDPSQEEQGLNSVFAADTSTLAIIKSFAKK